MDCLRARNKCRMVLFGCPSHKLSLQPWECVADLKGEKDASMQVIKGKRTRKTRSDKRHWMRPVLSVTQNECLARVSYIKDTPMKDSLNIFAGVRWLRRRSFSPLRHILSAIIGRHLLICMPVITNHPTYSVVHSSAVYGRQCGFWKRITDGWPMYALSITPYAAASHKRRIDRCLLSIGTLESRWTRGAEVGRSLAVAVKNLLDD